MSSEKGLVITPTEQLPFKCASSVILFFSVEISFPLISSFFPKGVGGKFYSFFSSLLSSRRVLSLSRCRKQRELQRVTERCTRATGTTPSLFVLFVSSSSSSSKERELKRERNLSLFFSPLQWVFVVQRKLLFFSLVKRNKKKASLY